MARRPARDRSGALAIPMRKAMNPNTVPTSSTAMPPMTPSVGATRPRAR
jgi:hypothetical protein